MDMDETAAAASAIRKWLESEKLETREVQDPQNFSTFTCPLSTNKGRTCIQCSNT